MDFANRSEACSSSKRQDKNQESQAMESGKLKTDVYASRFDSLTVYKT